MWIVRLALRRPYTFVVLAMLIVLTGVMTILRMPTDMYPRSTSRWSQPSGTTMASRPRNSKADHFDLRARGHHDRQRDRAHRELDALGHGGRQIFLQPGSSVDGAVAQVAAVSQPILRQMPPGAIAPLTMAYSATNVPSFNSA